jgi:hypothetical protein
MTSAIPAITSSLPEDLYYSAPIVLVRYPGESTLASATIRKRLTVQALLLATVCAALAFFFLAIRERKLTPAVPAARTPVAARREATAVPEPAPRLLSLPKRPNRKLTEFLLAESSDFQSLGRIRVKVTGVDVQRGSYNLAVRARGRQFTRTGVKLNQAVKLVDGRKAAPEIVVGAILQNRVWGYLSEPKAKPPAGHQRRRHRPIHSAARH